MVAKKMSKCERCGVQIKSLNKNFCEVCRLLFRIREVEHKLFLLDKRLKEVEQK